MHIHQFRHQEIPGSNPGQDCMTCPVGPTVRRLTTEFLFLDVCNNVCTLNTYAVIRRFQVRIPGRIHLLTSCWPNGKAHDYGLSHCVQIEMRHQEIPGSNPGQDCVICPVGPTVGRLTTEALFLDAHNSACNLNYYAVIRRFRV